MRTPDLSILLISWNTAHELDACLGSIPAGLGGDWTYEVVAVDNASTDGSREVLAAHPHVRLITNDRNRGFAAAVNQAYAASRGSRVLLLNSDIIFHEASLATMMRFLDEQPEASGVSPKYTNPDGSFQQHYVQFPSLAARIGLMTSLKRVPPFRGALSRFTMADEEFDAPRRLASGSCMLLNRDCLPDGPIMDERFPIYWNDALLARDLFDRGHQLWMLPDAVVVHARGASCVRLGPAVRFRHLIGSMVEYTRITGPRGGVAALQAAAVIDFAAKKVAARSPVLSWADLKAALRGDVGPLPTGDARAWDVVAAAALGEQGVSSGLLARARERGHRVLIVEPRGKGRGCTFEECGDDVWRARTPPPPRGRIGAARHRQRTAAAIRRWLDERPGPRTLITAHGAPELTGHLVEDRVIVESRTGVTVG